MSKILRSLKDIKKLQDEEPKGTVEQCWEMFEKTKDPECLAVIAERMPYFGKPEVGAKITELLRAPYKRKPLKKGIGYEIDTKHTRKNYNMHPQVQELVPYSASHIWRLELLGLFPRRIRLGGNSVVWLKSEVNSWIESKLASRNGDGQDNNTK